MRVAAIPISTPGERSRLERFDNSTNEGMFLKIGQIIRIDYEEMKADILLLSSYGTFNKVDISSAFSGPRSFLGGMPQEGALVLLDFEKVGNFRKPYIISFVNYGYKTGVKGDMVFKPKKFIEKNMAEQKRYMYRKLYPGDIYGKSTYGSEFLLDKDILISNSSLDEISLKSSDHSFNVSALNNNSTFAGIKFRSGMITRNDLIYDENLSFPIYYTEDGGKHYIITHCNKTKDAPYGLKTIDDGYEAFIEHRTEVMETAEPVNNVTYGNSGYEIDSFYQKKLLPINPLVINVLGTLVGNDSYSNSNKDRYGIILRPKIFNSVKETKGNLEEIICVNDTNKDETTTLAAAYTLKLPKSGTSIYINKEGKYFANIAASTSNDPMGSGESVELNSQGHIHAYLGKNKSESRSLNLYAEGGFITSIGADSVKNRSWEGIFKGGVNWTFDARDNNGWALSYTTNGDVSESINGSRYVEIKGNEVRTIYGNLEDKVFGKKVDHFIADKSTIYGGNYSETVAGNYAQTIALGKSLTIYSPNLGSTTAESTDILMGNSEFSIEGIGNKTEDLTLGNHETTILAGNKNISITLGNFQVDITTGDIKISTLLGSVDIDAAVGNVTINGMLGVTVNSLTSINLNAPTVGLGVAAIGGVVNDGPLGHKCYITGGPHLGSGTVRCNTV